MKKRGQKFGMFIEFNRGNNFMKFIFFILHIVFAEVCLCQTNPIELNIQKISADSFFIYIPKNTELEMWKTYDFILKTNLKVEDSIKLNYERTKIEDKIPIYDGLKFTLTFNTHEYGLLLFKNKKIIHRNLGVFNLKGTKYIVKVNDKEVSMFNGVSINPDSKIEINISSDFFDASKLLIKKPVFIYWKVNQKISEIFYFNNQRFVLDFKHLKNSKKATWKKEMLIITIS